MCFGNQATTGVTEVKMPAWMEAGGKDLLSKAQQYYSTPYQGYSGQRVANPSADTQSGFAMLQKLLTQPDYTAEAANMTREGAGSAAPGISKFMNPYLEQVLGTAVRGITNNADQERKRIGATAHMSGAFGDARQGVLEGEAAERTKRAIGDTTGAIGSQAFNTALGASEADQNRMMAGGQNLMNVGRSGIDQLLSRITGMLTGGQMQDNQQQKQLDVNYGNFLDQRNDIPNKIDMLIRALGGAGQGAGKTQTNMAPDNSGFQMLGSLASTILSMI